MKTKLKKSTKNLFKQAIPYVVALIVILGLVFVGSLNKTSSNNSSISMDALAKNNYKISTDQFSEMYMVANVSASMNLASTDAVSGNYVTVSVMRNIDQTTTEKIEKPSIVDTSNICQGVCIHVVAEGETMETIAAKYGMTTDQIRWSNDLKTTDVEVGQKLTVAGVPGIVHIVRSGEDANSMAEKYGSNAADIAALNENLAEGTTIIIPNGSLPESERPERYVRPTVAISSYSYYGSTSDRENMHAVYDGVSSAGGNPMVPGQCTWYAWWWRYTHGMALPGGPTLGSANTWASRAAALGYTVNRTPSYGAVFQTNSGWYGHVGIVVGVNGDGSIIVREMNYGGRAYSVLESTIPANLVGNFNYIH